MRRLGGRGDQLTGNRSSGAGRAFVPAAELSGAFYTELVRPLLAGRPHAAALLGWGSDVLGYDTERSTDHGWGPRLQVFLESDAADRTGEAAVLEERLAVELPETFRGWSVRFGWDDVAVRHHVTVTTLPVWLVEHLGVDAASGPVDPGGGPGVRAGDGPGDRPGDRPAGLSVLDWLLTPQQRLLGVVAGRVHADDTGELHAVRDALVWYPDQVWRWLLVCQWHRLAQEEAFVARTAEVRDHTGSAVAAARLVRDLMRLALLLDRRYAPYQKWLGTAFARLPHDDGLPEQLAAAVAALDLRSREAALAEAYETLARRHNTNGLTEPVDPATRGYYGRPGRVLLADRFAAACRATVTDPLLRELPLIGAVDQVCDSTDVLASPVLVRRLATLYGS